MLRYNQLKNYYFTFFICTVLLNLACILHVYISKCVFAVQHNDVRATSVLGILIQYAPEIL